MEGEKLSKILAQFNKQEALRLKKFLRSPFFNQRDDVIMLFDLLIKNPGIRGGELYSSLFPNTPYDDQKLRLVKSYLFRLIEKYLAVREFSDDDIARQYYLTIAYRKRGLGDYFKKAFKKARNLLDNQPERNSRFFEYNYRLHWEEHLLTSKDSPSDIKNLVDLSETLDLSYITQKLKNMCLIAAHQSIYHSEIEPGLSDEVLEYVQKSNLLEIPAVAIYLFGYQMFDDKKAEGAFQQFKSLVLEHGTAFPGEEIRDLYLMAINYCVRQLNDGNEAYAREAFELYQEGLKKEFLLDNGQLSRFTYHNIVAIGLKIGEYNWVDFFIHTFKNGLQRKYRDSSFSFSSAQLEFSRKKYGAVLELLQRANYRDLLLNLRAKTLLLKTYYELQENDLLSAHLDAMTNYIRRKRIMGYHKTNYQNIIRYTRKVLNVNPYDKKAKSQLAVLIEKEEVLTERNWLLERLEV